MEAVRAAVPQVCAALECVVEESWEEKEAVWRQGVMLLAQVVEHVDTLASTEHASLVAAAQGLGVVFAHSAAEAKLLALAVLARLFQHAQLTGALQSASEAQLALLGQNVLCGLQAVLSHKLTPAHRIPALELCDGALRVLGGAWPAASCGEWTEGKFVALLLHIVSVEIRMLVEDCDDNGEPVGDYSFVSATDAPSPAPLDAFVVCCGVIEQAVGFLVGDGDATEEGEGPWGKLPAEILLQVSEALHRVIESVLEYLEMAQEQGWRLSMGVLASSRLLCIYITEEREGALWQRARALAPFLVNVGTEPPEPFLLPFLHALQDDGESSGAVDMAAEGIEAKIKALGM